MAKVNAFSFLHRKFKNYSCADAKKLYNGSVNTDCMIIQ